MKRVLLNAICFVLIILSCIGIVLVVEKAKEDTVDNLNTYQQEEHFNPGEFQGDQGQRPEMNNGEEPPVKPEGDMSGMRGERPERPQGDMGEMPQGERPQGMPGQQPSENNEDSDFGTIKLTSKHIIIIIVLVTISILSIMILISTELFSNSFKKVFINGDKVIIFTLLTIVISCLLSFIIIVLVQNIKVNNEDSSFEVDRGENVNVKKINLSDYDSNITIDKAGEYTLTGSIKHTVLVETDGDVVLNLNNVTIESVETAAIANIGTNKITINLIKDTKNILKDNGSGDYDGGLFSNGPMVINGEGTLYVYGQQEEGEGIATTDNDITINGGVIVVEANDDGLNAGGDNGGTITINGGELYIKALGDGIDSNDNIVINGGTIYAMGSSVGGDAGIDADNGFVINGGTVIALGSDMLEQPKESKQNYLAVSLNNKVSQDEIITLLNEEDEVVISFKAGESFRTLIISNKELNEGNYKLYTGGKNTGELVNNVYVGGKYTKGTLLQEVSVK